MKRVWVWIALGMLLMLGQVQPASAGERYDYRDRDNGYRERRDARSCNGSSHRGDACGTERRRYVDRTTRGVCQPVRRRPTSYTIVEVGGWTTTETTRYRKETTITREYHPTVRYRVDRECDDIDD